MVGVVFQPRTLDLDLSVVQNLTYHAALHGIGNREGRKRADDVLARIALAERGQRQGAQPVRRTDAALEIARALAAPPAPARARRAHSGPRHQITGRHHRSCAPPRRREGVSVLWATHLIDEVAAGRRCHRAASGPGSRAWRGHKRGADPGRTGYARRVHAADAGAPVQAESEAS
jgi:ABC-2 type transport system ATP-binding protein